MAQTRRTLLRCCAAGTGVTILSTSAQAQTSDVITTETPQEVPAATEVSISGETTLSNDAELTVTIRSAGGTNPRFTFDKEISPTDGSWNTTFDLSFTQPGDGFYLTIRDMDGQLLLDEDWTVVDPELFFLSIDSLALRDPASSAVLTRRSGNSWSREIASIAPDETLSLDLWIRDDGERILLPDIGAIELETSGGITATVDGMSITITAMEPGEATLQITVVSNRNEDFQAPPLPITVTEPAETPTENTSDTGSDTAPDSDDNSTDPDESTATDNTTNGTAENEPSEPVDTSTDSVPGFTVPSTLAALGGGVYLIRERLEL